MESIKESFGAHRIKDGSLVSHCNPDLVAPVHALKMG
jgi:hypothetical protein